MRIHLLATMAILTAALFTGCDSAREVSDTGHSNAYGCDQCHGYPPPPHFPASADAKHPVGVTAAMCSVCHPSTVNSDGHTIVPNGTHRNGQVEAIEIADLPAAAACNSCHSTPPDTGLHAFHMGLPGKNLTCATCHAGYVVGDADVRAADATLHMNGVHDVVLGRNGYVVQAYDDPTGWPDAECKQCHDHRFDPAP